MGIHVRGALYSEVSCLGARTVGSHVLGRGPVQWSSLAGAMRFNVWGHCTVGFYVQGTGVPVQWGPMCWGGGLTVVSQVQEELYSEVECIIGNGHIGPLPSVNRQT